MKIMKTITKEVEEVDDIFCNKCGESLWHHYNFCGLESTYIQGCYGSPILDDGSAYKFSLCEACLDELFKTFKIPVEIEGEY